MKDRIQAFLHSENKSYAQFAEEIGVQPSGISHILSGRNNPSLDFVIKMLHRYPSLSAEWLLFGRGSMYKYVSQPTLFDAEMPAGSSDEVSFTGDSVARTHPLESSMSPEMPLKEEAEDETVSESPSRRLVRIVMFYSDKSFTEYTPA